ncbi:MAG: hypothetical protein HY684_05045 [Chloroflexi bacterium]|nr:hypothetical protein [Chloroflexota bacterium]
MNPESVALARDIVFIVVSILGVACAIVITTLIVLAYLRVVRILNDIGRVVHTARKAADAVGSAVSAAIPGVGIGARLVRGLMACCGSGQDKPSA